MSLILKNEEVNLFISAREHVPHWEGLTYVDITLLSTHRGNMIGHNLYQTEVCSKSTLYSVTSV